MKTIRLKAPIRVAHEIHPNNAVFDASDEVADALIEGRDGVPCAELTDAIERYPIGNPLTFVDDYPVSGTEKFPIDQERKPPVAMGNFVNHTDRLVADQIRAHEPPPEFVSKEPAPARVEVGAAEKKRAKEEADEAAAARVADAMPVVVVKDTKGK